MARGWESKSVEDQIETAEATKSRENAVRLTEEQIRILRERESLELSRTRVLRDLATATHERYREQLKSALKHLDDRLAELH
jgi:hypothetical protein